MTSRIRMMTHKPPHASKFSAIGMLAIAAFGLSACELRQDGAEEEPEPAITPTESVATPTPTPSETASPVNSILRDDDETSVAVVAPPQPVNITIPFPDGADLSARAERMLVGILDSRALEENWPVVLGGHTDSSGNDQANLRASRSRAEAVAAWLVENGVDDERIVVIGFGEQNPIQPNALPDGTANEAGRRANRRVELRIAPKPHVESEEDQETENTSED